MTRTQIESLARGLSPVVKELVQQTLGPLVAELERLKGENASLVTQVSGLSLKVNAFEAIQKSVQTAAPLDTAILERLVSLEVSKAVSAIRVPEDGKSVTAEELQPLVSSAVWKAVAELPQPKDGAPGADGQVGPVGPAGADGRDGNDVSMDVVEGLVTRAIAALPKAKDGIGLAGALIDREGQLVVTLTDGTSKALGLVVGKDADPSEVRSLVVEEVAKIPRPKDGEKGADGRDGTLENIKLAQIDERTWQWQFKDGTPVEGGSIRVPTLIFRDYWDAEKAYEPGDVVMRDGSSWLAVADNVKAQPGTNLGAAAWRLIAKRGRDGREGKQGIIGPAGPRGEKGTDGRNGYS
jgi:hypothetical protein